MLIERVKTLIMKTSTEQRNSETIQEAEENVDRLTTCFGPKAQNKITVILVNKIYDNMTHFKYFETTVTNQYYRYIHEEIINRLTLRNAYWHSAQHLPSSCLIFKYKD